MFGQVCVGCIMYVSFTYFAHPTENRYRAVVIAFTSVSRLVYLTHPGLFQWVGMTPVLSPRVIMYVSGVAMWMAESLSSLALIPSTPVALFG